jgi:hypothetical protein
MYLPLKQCRKRIAAMWFSIAGLCFVIMVAQSLLGAYRNTALQAWGWFLANTMPTSSIVVSHLVSDAKERSHAGAPGHMIDAFYYKLSMILSSFYLVLILVTLLGWRLTAYQDPYDVMALSSVWIGPVQGVVASTITIFFKEGSKATTHSDRTQLSPSNGQMEG